MGPMDRHEPEPAKDDYSPSAGAGLQEAPDTRCPTLVIRHLVSLGYGFLIRTFKKYFLLTLLISNRMYLQSDF